MIRMQVDQCDNNGEESATLVLSGATGGGIVADPTTVIDVVGDNNLVATPGLYIRGNTVDTTAGIAQVPVMLGGPTGQTSTSTVTVNYTTANGPAAFGTDYSTTSGQLDSSDLAWIEQSISGPGSPTGSSSFAEPEPTWSSRTTLEREHRSVHGHGDHRSETWTTQIAACHLRTAAHGDRRG